jgi:type II secretory pathway component PulF
MTDRVRENANRISLGRQLAAVQIAAELLALCAPHQRALLGLLAVADQQGIKTAPLIASLGDELPRVNRIQMLSFANRLSEDSDPIQALAETRGLLPANVVLGLRLAQAEGTLSELYRQFDIRSTTYDSVPLGPAAMSSSRAFLALGKTFVFMMLLVFISARIVPEHQKMMQEFGVEPSAAFLQMNRWLDLVFRYWMIPYLVLLLAMAVNFGFIRRFSRRWNSLTWRQPLPSSAADQRRGLALIAQSDFTTIQKVDHLAQATNRRSSKRLEKIKQQIGSGHNPWDAFAHARLISKKESRQLKMTDDDDTQAWLLRLFASRKQSVANSRRSLAIRTFVAAINAGLILLVAMVAISIFLVLIQTMASIREV